MAQKPAAFRIQGSTRSSQSSFRSARTVTMATSRVIRDRCLPNGFADGLRAASHRARQDLRDVDQRYSTEGRLRSVSSESSGFTFHIDSASSIISP